MHPIIIYIVPIFFKGSKSCSYLYPPKNDENDQLPEATDGQFEGFRRIEHNVRKKLTETLNQDLQGAIVRQSLVAGGLCMALSYVNRYFRQREGRKARILVLTASGSTSFHYMNVVIYLRYEYIIFNQNTLKYCTKALNQFYIKWPIHQRTL